MSGSRSRDWDAATYDRISGPQIAWAREQIERLALTGDEVVLDAGCGSGRVTAMIAELVPRGRVYGVDVAPSMIAHAREALGERVTFLQQDLLALELPEPVDAVFSNATFHWIADHTALFARLYGVTKPGGRLVAQCGGEGNISAFRVLADEVATEEPFAPHFADWHGPWNYAGPAETSERLQAAGYVDVRTWLQDKSTPLDDARPFVTTVCLVSHLDRLPADLREPYVDAVMARYPRPVVLEYVRLNMLARRP